MQAFKVWSLKQVLNISILFQKQSMGHVGHFKFLKIFQCHLLKKCFKNALEDLKFGLLKEVLQAENFWNAFWTLKQFLNISILFQKESMGHVGHLKFLKIFHYHLLKKCFKKAVEAFKVWASKGITAGWKFSKCILKAKKVSNISVLF